MNTVRRVVITIEGSSTPELLRWLRQLVQTLEHNYDLLALTDTPHLQPFHDSAGTRGLLCVTPPKAS